MENKTGQLSTVFGDTIAEVMGDAAAVQ